MGLILGEIKAWGKRETHVGGPFTHYHLKGSCLKRPLCLLIKPAAWDLLGNGSSIECLSQGPSIVYFEK